MSLDAASHDGLLEPGLEQQLFEEPQLPVTASSRHEGVVVAAGPARTVANAYRLGTRPATEELLDTPRTLPKQV